MRKNWKRHNIDKKGAKGLDKFEAFLLSKGLEYQDMLNF